MRRLENLERQAAELEVGTSDSCLPPRVLTRPDASHGAAEQQSIWPGAPQPLTESRLDAQIQQRRAPDALFHPLSLQACQAQLLALEECVVTDASFDGPDVQILSGQDAGRRKQRLGLNSKMADATSLLNPSHADPLRQFWFPVMFSSKARPRPALFPGKPPISQSVPSHVLPPPPDDYQPTHRHNTAPALPRPPISPAQLTPFPFNPNRRPTGTHSGFSTSSGRSAQPPLAAPAPGPSTAPTAAPARRTSRTA